jgi:hypothetical protein
MLWLKRAAWAALEARELRRDRLLAGSWSLLSAHQQGKDT